MRLPWQKDRRVSAGLAEARRQAGVAERKLAAENEHVVIPLRELREKNHVRDAIITLIQRRGPENDQPVAT